MKIKVDFLVPHLDKLKIVQSTIKMFNEKFHAKRTLNFVFAERHRSISGLVGKKGEIEINVNWLYSKDYTKLDIEDHIIYFYRGKFPQ